MASWIPSSGLGRKQDVSVGRGDRTALYGARLADKRRMPLPFLAVVCICAAISFIGAGSLSTAAAADSDSRIGVLQMIDQKVGTGTQAEAGHAVTVHYTGWLEDKSAPDEKGKKIDSSHDRNQPFQFRLGAGEVIKGWDEGVAGMKVGGERTLIIPPELGYGSRGAGGVIPPNATLIFQIQLLSVD
jgi:FKBP-type peptidyl-prolyl cis-trans isomerase FkpA